jgi:hypothetical protein
MNPPSPLGIVSIVLWHTPWSTSASKKPQPRATTEHIPLRPLLGTGDNFCVAYNALDEACSDTNDARSMDADTIRVLRDPRMSSVFDGSCGLPK